MDLTPDFDKAGGLLPAVQRLAAMRAGAQGVGLIPEQAWDDPDLAPGAFTDDPTDRSIGFTNGEPAGSASAMTWSAGQYVRLMLDISAARLALVGILSGFEALLNPMPVRAPAR